MIKFLAVIVIGPALMLLVLAGFALALLLACSFIAWDFSLINHATSSFIDGFTWAKFRGAWVLLSIATLVVWAFSDGLE